MPSTFGLNIKDAEVRRLAEALAELTGESITEAVIEALRQRLSGRGSLVAEWVWRIV